MPWSTSFTDCSADIRFTGATDGDEIFAADIEIVSHSYQEHLRYALIDFTKAESMNLLTVDLIRLAEANRQYLLRNPPYAVVIIAPQGVVFGHARMYEHFMEGTTLRSKVVKSRDDAEDWLRSIGFSA